MWLHTDPRDFLTVSGAEWSLSPEDQVAGLLTALCCQKNPEMSILGKESDSRDMSHVKILI